MRSDSRRPARSTAGRKPSTRKAPARRARTASKTPAPSVQEVAVAALKDMKAMDIKVLDVRALTDVADHMIIASGTSDRHVRSIAERVVEKCKEAGFRAHGVEGRADSDWVLIDLTDLIVHVMLPRTREFYGLERLWDMTAAKRAAVRAPG